jgi:hypothetical protein
VRLIAAKTAPRAVPIIGFEQRDMVVAAAEVEH